MPSRQAKRGLRHDGKADTLCISAVAKAFQILEAFGSDMGCMQDDSAVYVIPMQSIRTANPTDHPGFRVPLYATTTGRVLLGFPGRGPRDRLVPAIMEAAKAVSLRR